MHRTRSLWPRKRTNLFIHRRRLWLEELETRALPSGGPLANSWPPGFQPVTASGTNVTLDQAQSLSTLNAGAQLGVTGTIGNGPAGAADVEFYSFDLTQPARVELQTFDQAQAPHLDAVLSLYDSDGEDPLGNHLIAQEDASGTASGFADISRTLAAGTYYVAVSGSGNRYFNPFVVGSGYDGATGSYALRIAATDVGIQPTDGPAVLSALADVAAGNQLGEVPLPGNPTLPGDPATANIPQLASSPTLLRVELSSEIDANLIAPDSNVVLNFSSTNDFTSATQLFGLQVNFDDNPGQTEELQITPSTPLAPGYYQLQIIGNTNDSIANPSLQALLDVNDVNPLGFNAANPTGQDYTFTFEVTGSKGVQTANAVTGVDTPATALVVNPLPNSISSTSPSGNPASITGAGRFQFTGTIGNDPTDPAGFNPANEVDLYHFRVDGSGNFAFAAEVFASRIGSTLSADLTLFKENAAGGLDFVASNNGTGNSNPWLTDDPALFASLGAGDYYLAVSSGKNFPDATTQAGTNGIFDPMVSHSGSLGNSTGQYVLDLEVEPAIYPPHVVATSLAGNPTLTAPLTTFTVQFDRPVNAQQLAFAPAAGLDTNQSAAVFLEDANGNKIYPSFVSYDQATNQATYMMLDAIANGSYTLHLSGANGLTDLAGDPLVGSDPTNPAGDYVVPFTLTALPRGTPGNPTAWVSKEPNNSLTAAQTLGPLFPHELKTGVSISATSALPTDTADYYQFSLLTAENYQFQVTSTSGATPTLTLYGAQGQVTLQLQFGRTGTYVAQLPAGTYTLGVTWRASGNTQEAYTVVISAPRLHENATPLTNGPAPALSLRLVSDVPPPAPPTTVPVIPTPGNAPAPTLLPQVPPTPTEPPSSTVFAGPVTPDTSPATTLPTALIPAAVLPAGNSTPSSQESAPPTTSRIVSSLPPQLALALSEGPVGGVRGLANSAAIPEAGSSAPPVLAALATPLLAPSLVNNSGDSTRVVAEIEPVRIELLNPEGLLSLVAPQVDWVVTQPYTVTREAVRTGVAATEILDRIWLPISQSQQLEAPVTLPMQEPAAPATIVRYQATEPAAFSEAAAESQTPPATTSLQPFWWVAASVLGTALGAIQAQKWYVTRQKKGPPQLQKSMPV